MASSLSLYFKCKFKEEIETSLKSKKEIEMKQKEAMLKNRERFKAGNKTCVLCGRDLYVIHTHSYCRCQEHEQAHQYICNVEGCAVVVCENKGCKCRFTTISEQIEIQMQERMQEANA